MGLFSKYRFFWQTDAPGSFYGLYLLTSLRRRLNRREVQATNETIGSQLDRIGQFTTRWSDDCFADWLAMFEAENLAKKESRALEIGSWEGRTTVFLLSRFPKLHVDAVDTWKGGDEHSVDTPMQDIERLFDANVAAFGERIRKFKGTSIQFFARGENSETYDLIFVDGSHFVDDVVCDAVHGFRCLKSGGVMIFDDHVWDWYPNPKNNPAFAIHWFLRLRRGEYKVLGLTRRQLIIKKLVSRERAAPSD